nr:metallophosphoesterase [Nannocystis pusilla]
MQLFAGASAWSLSHCRSSRVRTRCRITRRADGSAGRRGGRGRRRGRPTPRRVRRADRPGRRRPGSVRQARRRGARRLRSGGAVVEPEPPGPPTEPPPTPPGPSLPLFVEGSTTFVVLPDTQYYSLRFPGVFSSQTKWIARNAIDRNIAYVFHLGDLVHYNKESEWKRASAAMAELDGIVPYGLVTGNHDYGPAGDASTRESLFNQWFSFDDTELMPSFGGAYEAGKLDNSFHLFDAGGHSWVALLLEWGPRDEVVEWANDVMGLYADRLGILVTHAYLNHNDRRYDHNDDIYPQAYNPHWYGTPGGVNDGEELWQSWSGSTLRPHPERPRARRRHRLSGQRRRPRPRGPPDALQLSAPRARRRGLPAAARARARRADDARADVLAVVRPVPHRGRSGLHDRARRRLRRGRETARGTADPPRGRRCPGRGAGLSSCRSPASSNACRWRPRPVVADAEVLVIAVHDVVAVAGAGHPAVDDLGGGRIAGGDVLAGGLPHAAAVIRWEKVEPFEPVWLKKLLTPMSLEWLRAAQRAGPGR